MKKRSGRHNRICGRRRPNDKFSGKGRRIHACRDCARMPKNEREMIGQADEIFSYLRQSHISKTNGARTRKDFLEKLVDAGLIFALHW